jgi:hypothetical protein
LSSGTRFAALSLLCAQLVCVFGGPPLLPPSSLTAAAIESQLPLALTALADCTDSRLAPLCSVLVAPMLRSLVAAAVSMAAARAMLLADRELGRGLLWTQVQTHASLLSSFSSRCLLIANFHFSKIKYAKIQVEHQFCDCFH